MRILVLGLTLVTIQACYGETACFRTATEAATQVGVRKEGGFRLEATRTDAFSGATWATVKSCTHPEWPELTLIGREKMRITARQTEPVVGKRLMVLAGSRVRLVRVEESVRLELAGVVQMNGAIGDLVRVRILQLNGEGESRFAMGVIRSSDLVEMER